MINKRTEQTYMVCLWGHSKHEARRRLMRFFEIFCYKQHPNLLIIMVRTKYSPQKIKRTIGLAGKGKLSVLSGDVFHVSIGSQTKTSKDTIHSWFNQNNTKIDDGISMVICPDCHDEHGVEECKRCDGEGEINLHDCFDD